MEKDMHVLSLTRKGSKYSVVLSNGDTLTVSEDMVVEYRLVKGKEIDNETYDVMSNEIIFYEALEKARAYAISFIKTSKQVYDYLIKKGYDDKISERCVNNLLEARVIDDEAIKNSYVSELTRAGNGRLMIKSKLYEKGLDTSFEVNEEEYYAAMQHLITVKLKSLKDNKEIRLKRYLASRGYTIDEICKGLRGISFE